MKKFLLKLGLIFFFLSSAICSAATQDAFFYAGADAAYAKLNYSSSWATSHYQVDSVSKTDDHGLGGRFFAGYQFNPFFATELSYVYLPEVEIHDATKSNVNGGNVTLREKAADGLFKGMLPMGSFCPFVKAGLAWVNRRPSTAIISNAAYTISSEEKIVPVGGMGIDYNINDYLRTEAFFMRYFNSNNDIKPINLLGAGLTYKF